MENTLLHIHSILRYAVLFTGLYAIIKAYSGMQNNKEFLTSDNKAGSWFVMSVHIQFLIGIFVYIYSPIAQAFLNNMGAGMKDAQIRFYGMEHFLMMLIAVVIITIGRAKSKRATTPKAKHKKAFTFYLIGLIIILASIPWPFIAKHAGRNWF